MEHGYPGRREDRVPCVGGDASVGVWVAHDIDRIEALLDALQLLAQQSPYHNDAGIQMRQVFERVDRDRAPALLRFEIDRFALPFLVAAFEVRARADVGNRVKEVIELSSRACACRSPPKQPRRRLPRPSSLI